MSDSPENMLQNILGNPEAMNKIGSILSSLGENSDDKAEKKENSSPLPAGLDNAQMMLKLGQIMERFSDNDDNGVRLITALQPYLSGKRAESAQQAIKILKLSRMTSLLGDIDL